MDFPPQYWQMAMLKPSGTQQANIIQPVHDWLQTLTLSDLNMQGESDRAIQLWLWNLWRAHEVDHSLLARLSLRCWISHQIVRACNRLATDFGWRHGFTADELWPLVLTDDGSLEPSYHSCTLKILDKYDPQKGALSTWSDRITLSSPEVIAFCFEHELYRISDWALLNNTSPGQLARLPGLYGDQLAQKQALLQTYHSVYRRDRILRRNRSGRTGRCQDPTTAQLIEISEQLSRQQSSSDIPTERLILDELSALADQLREYVIANRVGQPPTAPLTNFNEYSTTHNEKNEGAIEQNEDEQVEDDFLQRYRTHFLETLDEAIAVTIQAYTNNHKGRRQPKDKIYLAALNFFHCESIGMTDIARIIGFPGQPSVSKLLQLSRFRADITGYWLRKLRQQVEKDALEHMSLKRLKQISHEIDLFLQENTKAEMNKAAAEAQSSHSQATRSLFSRRVCAQLQNSDS